MDRQQRRDLKHDKFVDEIGSLSTRARENQRLLFTIAAAAVVIAVLAYGIYFYRSNREQKAQEALGTAIETIESPLLPAPGAQPVPGAKFKTEAERTAAAEKQFKDVERRTTAAPTPPTWPRSTWPASPPTRATSPRHARACRSSSTIIRSTCSSAGARYSLYQLRIDNGEAPQVAQELQAEIARREPSLPADSLLALLAHAYDVQGNAEKTKETYRRIVTEFPDSPYALEAQRKIGPA